MASDQPTLKFASVDHITQVLAFLVLSATLVIGVRYSTLAVGSPESACTVGQARMFVDGQRSLPSPLPDERFAAELSGMLVPSGFVAMTDGSDRSVPGCPAGLSFAMSGAIRLGGEPAAFLLVPLFGVLAIWATFTLGRALAGPWAGVVAAALVGCSPLFLDGLIHPISDVPAAALFVASLAAAMSAGVGSDAFRFKRAIGTGLLAGLAVMMRPHLVPLVAFPIMLVRSDWQPVGGKRSDQQVSHSRLVVATVFGMLPLFGTVAWLQWRVYGSPLGSGTTAADSVVGLGQAAANMVWYPWWLASLHTPVLALAFLAPFMGWNNQSRRDNHSRSICSASDAVTNTPGVVDLRHRVWLLLGFALAVWGMELPYGSVTGWQQARALLPALPVLIVLTVAVAWWILGRLGSVWRPVALLAVAAVAGGWWVHTASDLGIFRMKAVERKYREVGRFAATKLSPDVVVLAVLPAGAIRNDAETPTLTWSAIPADRLDTLLDDLRNRGLTPLITLDRSEREVFKTRFAGRTPLADLDWPARVTIGRDILIYDPADRTRQLAGEKIPTVSISWPR